MEKTLKNGIKITYGGCYRSDKTGHGYEHGECTQCGRLNRGNDLLRATYLKGWSPKSPMRASGCGR